MHLFEAKEAICEYGRRLWQRGYVAANDGNLSVRLGDDRLLATPTGVSKGFMSPQDLILCDMSGTVVSGERKASSELKMHLAVYHGRPDIRAVVHAHPPFATAFAVAGVPLDQCLLPESVLTMGAIPIAPYATPSTDEIPDSIQPFIPRCDAVLLANHGAVVWAGDLEAAYYRLETVEHSATITHRAMALGAPRRLSAEDVSKLQQVRSNMGLGGRNLPCQDSGSCPVVGGPTPPDERSQLIERVTQAVLEGLPKK